MKETHCFRVLHIGATPLMHACQQGDRARVLRLLKEQEETIAYRDRTLRNALHYCMDASTGGAVAAAAPELVNAPDAEGHTPLHLAVIAGDTQLVAVLLANGANVNAKDLEGHSVLHWATGTFISKISSYSCKPHQLFLFSFSTFSTFHYVNKLYLIYH